MKRFSRFLAILAALLMLCTSALADLQVYAPNIEVTDEGIVRTVVYASKDGNLSAEDMTITMDANEIKPASVISFERSDMGTSWVYVVDLSTADRAENIQSLLISLVSNLGEFDNAAVYTTGMEAGAIQLTQDKNALNTVINGVEKEKKSSALNSKIADAIAYLDGNSEARERKAIVVISNGQNADTSVTQEELLDKTAKSEAAIYTMAMELRNPEASKVNTFGAIARSSKGGMAISVPYADKDMSTAAAQVNSNEKRFRVVEIDPESLEAAPAEMSITIRDGSFEKTVVASFNAVQRAALNKRINDRIAREATPTPTVEPTPTPEPTEEVTTSPNGTEGTVIDEEEKKFELDNKMILIILGAVLAVLVIVLVVVLASKKNKVAHDYTVASEDGSVTTPAGGIGETEAVGPAYNTGVTVVLDQVGIAENKRYSAQIVDTIVVGRVASKARIVIPDEKVSGAHLRLIYAGGMMYAEDMMSRNGTKVNGTPISGRVALHKQDVITIGLTNLRINWQ